MTKYTLLLGSMLAASSVSAQIIADFSTDVGNFAGGFGPGWFNGGVFGTTVESGWDAGDYDWQLGQDLTASTTTDFSAGDITFGSETVEYNNVGGVWDSAANNITYGRATDPVEFRTADSALNVIALTFDVLAASTNANVTADFGASGGGATAYQLFLNGTAVDTRATIGSVATQNVSSTFSLNQGDVLYFVFDSDGGQGSDLRGVNLTVTVPEPSAYGLLAGILAMSWVMLRRRG